MLNSTLWNPSIFPQEGCSFLWRKPPHCFWRSFPCVFLTPCRRWKVRPPSLCLWSGKLLLLVGGQHFQLLKFCFPLCPPPQFLCLLTCSPRSPTELLWLLFLPSLAVPHRCGGQWNFFIWKWRTNLGQLFFWNFSFPLKPVASPFSFSWFVRPMPKICINIPSPPLFSNPPPLPFFNFWVYFHCWSLFFIGFYLHPHLIFYPSSLWMCDVFFPWVVLFQAMYTVQSNPL